MSEPISISIIYRPGMSPMDRGWFEDQILEALGDEGEFYGGGGMVDGSSSDSDLGITDRKRGVAVILDVLRREKAPPHTEVVVHDTPPVRYAVYNEQFPYVAPEEE
jgi:hypothetical protein